MQTTRARLRRLLAPLVLLTMLASAATGLHVVGVCDGQPLDAAPCTLWHRADAGDQLAWKADTPVLASPSGDRVYVILDGQDGASVRAFDGATGAVAWSMPLAGVAASLRLAPDGKSVYASTYAGVWALRATTGAVLWSSAILGGGMVLSDNGKTLVAHHANLAPAGTPGLSAVRAETGATLWARAASYGTLAANPGKRLFAQGPDQQGLSIAAIRMTDGAILWQQPADPGTPVGQPLLSADAPSGSVVFAARTFTGTPSLHVVVGRLAAGTGQLTWSSEIQPALGATTADPPVGLAIDGPLGVLAVAGSTQVTGMRLATGQALWTFSFLSPQGQGMFAGITINPVAHQFWVFGLQRLSVAQPAQGILVAIGTQTGKEVAAATYAPTATDAVVEGLSVSHDGTRLFAAGVQIQKVLPSGSDLVVLAYPLPLAPPVRI
ncbi:MAG: PQQ-binding-like beta-propeller repeat protein [bacterium]